MSNPTVSFRISDYHLARGLRAIRIIEPSWRLTTTSDLIRTIFNDYIAKSEHLHNSPLTLPDELLQEIKQARIGATKQTEQIDQLKPLGQKTKKDLEEEKIFLEIKQATLAAQALRNMQTNEQISIIANNQQLIKPSEFNDPNLTDSITSTVTDFSPPKDWIE